MKLIICEACDADKAHAAAASFIAGKDAHQIALIGWRRHLTAVPARP